VRVVFEDVIDDREQVGEALAGAGAGTDDERLALLRDLRRLGLVLAQPLPRPKEPGCGGVNRPVVAQNVKEWPVLVRRVELQHPLGP